MKKTITYCNYCGKEFDKADMTGGIRIAHFLGYGSIHDGNHLTLDLCSDCLDNLIDSCKISPLEECKFASGLSDIVYTADHTVACTTMPDGNTDPYQIPMEA